MLKQLHNYKSKGGLVLVVLSICLLANFAVAEGSKKGVVSGSDRIAVAGGDITEIIYLLGEQHRLVAVDSTSNYPPVVSDLEQLGYLRQLNAEGVLATRPDLFLANADVGPPQVVKQLTAAGVPVQLFASDYSYLGVLEKIEQVALSLGVVEQGRLARQDLQLQMQQMQTRIDRLADKPRVIFLLAVNQGSLLAGGRETAAQSIVELAGGQNPLQDFTGYKPVSAEALAAARVDYLLMMEGALTRAGGDQSILENPELELALAGKTSNVISMDGSLLLAFGPRIVQAVAQLAGLIHEDF